MTTKTDFIEIKEPEWFDTFKPVLNHIDDNPSFDGYMFETFSPEVDFVKSSTPTKVWTLVHGDYDTLYIYNGFKVVNRVGYFVTENEWQDGITYQVVVAEPQYFCPNPECETEWTGLSAMTHWDKFEDLQKCAACATMDELKTLEDFPLTLDESE